MTPINKIINVFYSKFQSKIELPEGLVHQFLITSLGEFSNELYVLHLTDDEQFIIEDINLSEIAVLGSLMYKQYLHRERDKTLKLNNIVGRDIKLTAMGNSKYAMNTAYTSLLGEIDLMLDKLKPLKFD